jgi:hypothetical protein
MATLTPWRALPAERRIAVIMASAKQHKEVRAALAARIAQKGGGFRAVTLMTWSPEKLAKEVVRLNALQPQDELDMLLHLYVELEPAIQITFLDAAGVPHKDGHIAEEATPPFCDAATTKKAVETVRAQFGDACEHYLLTITTYNKESWPGIEELVVINK